MNPSKNLLCLTFVPDELLQLAPRMAAAAKEGNTQETTPPTTILAPRMAAVTNQGNAQETTPPTTTLSVEVDHCE